jgi:hypothetical protein
MHRDKLVELGLIDARGVKLSINRKFWHPIKSIRVMSYAAWAGTTDPEVAVRAWESRNEVPEAPADVPELWNGMPELTALTLSDAPVSPAPGMSKRWSSVDLVAADDALQLSEPNLTQPERAARLGVSDSRLRQARRAVRNGDPGE